MKIITREEIKQWKNRGEGHNKLSLKRCGKMIRGVDSKINHLRKEKVELGRKYLVISLALEEKI